MRSYSFESEAEMLWQKDGAADSANYVAGLVLLQCSLITHGTSKRATKYTASLHAMTARMRLFGTDDRIGPEELQLLAPEQQSALTYAAWGAFNTIRFV